MLSDPQKLVDDFVCDLNSLMGISIDKSRVLHDFWAAPHKAKDLPAGSGAVYIFSLSSIIVTRAGPGRVLKVGKAGPNSNARFRYQHYASGSALSTLAGAIENNKLLWDYIGYAGKDTSVGDWIRKNTDRNNFYFKDEKVMGFFEVYAKALLGPIFEGSLSSNA